MNIQELRAVEETAKEITQTNGHDWDKEIVDLAFAYQAQAKLLEEAREVIGKIASCESCIEGDVVSIAQAFLKKLEGE